VEVRAGLHDGVPAAAGAALWGFCTRMLAGAVAPTCDNAFGPWTPMPRTAAVTAQLREAPVDVLTDAVLSAAAITPLTGKPVTLELRARRRDVLPDGHAWPLAGAGDVCLALDVQPADASFVRVTFALHLCLADGVHELRDHARLLPVATLDVMSLNALLTFTRDAVARESVGAIVDTATAAMANLSAFPRISGRDAQQLLRPRARLLLLDGGARVGDALPAYTPTMPPATATAGLAAGAPRRATARASVADRRSSVMSSFATHQALAVYTPTMAAKRYRLGAARGAHDGGSDGAPRRTAVLDDSFADVLQRAQAACAVLPAVLCGFIASQLDCTNAHRRVAVADMREAARELLSAVCEPGAAAATATPPSARATRSASAAPSGPAAPPSASVAQRWRIAAMRDFAADVNMVGAVPGLGGEQRLSDVLRVLARDGGAVLLNSVADAAATTMHRCARAACARSVFRVAAASLGVVLHHHCNEDSMLLTPAEFARVKPLLKPLALAEADALEQEIRAALEVGDEEEDGPAEEDADDEEQHDVAEEQCERMTLDSAEKQLLYNVNASVAARARSHLEGVLLAWRRAGSPQASQQQPLAAAMEAARTLRDVMRYMRDNRHDILRLAQLARQLVLCAHDLYARAGIMGSIIARATAAARGAGPRAGANADANAVKCATPYVKPPSVLPQYRQLDAPLVLGFDNFVALIRVWCDDDGGRAGAAAPEAAVSAVDALDDGEQLVCDTPHAADPPRRATSADVWKAESELAAYGRTRVAPELLRDFVASRPRVRALAARGAQLQAAAAVALCNCPLVWSYLFDPDAAAALAAVGAVTCAAPRHAPPVAEAERTRGAAWLATARHAASHGNRHEVNGDDVRHWAFAAARFACGTRHTHAALSIAFSRALLRAPPPLAHQLPRPLIRSLCIRGDVRALLYTVKSEARHHLSLFHACRIGDGGGGAGSQQRRPPAPAAPLPPPGFAYQTMLNHRQLVRHVHELLQRARVPAASVMSGPVAFGWSTIAAASWAGAAPPAHIFRALSEDESAAWREHRSVPPRGDAASVYASATDAVAAACAYAACGGGARSQAVFECYTTDVNEARRFARLQRGGTRAEPNVVLKVAVNALTPPPLALAALLSGAGVCGRVTRGSVSAAVAAAATGELVAWRTSPLQANGSADALVEEVAADAAEGGHHAAADVHAEQHAAADAHAEQHAAADAHAEQHAAADVYAEQHAAADVHAGQHAAAAGDAAAHVHGGGATMEAAPAGTGVAGGDAPPPMTPTLEDILSVAAAGSVPGTLPPGALCPAVATVFAVLDAVTAEAAALRAPAGDRQ
jgi:hypothetical protein